MTDAVAFDLPMRVRFRGITSRRGIVFRGRERWAEFSPFAEYGVEESSAWLRAALEAADHPWPTPVRDRVPVNCTIPAVGPERAAELVLAGHGCRTAKVKVAESGQSLDDDLARVVSVRDALGPGGLVRIDANGGWTVAEAVEAIGVLGEVGLEYVEQPCAAVEELAAVRRAVDVPIAADESIRKADDPFRVRALEAADIAVIKVQPLGGVRACLRLADELAMPVVVSSALESSVGLSAGIALAAALPELPYACGLATASMFERDLVREPWQPVDGALPVADLQPDAGLLGEARAADDTAAPLMARLAACRRYLEEAQ